MHFLLLSILSSTGIFLIFKITDKLNIPSYPVIVINYLVASLLAGIITGSHTDLQSIITSNWFLLSVFIGIFFILMFFVIAVSTRKAGITVTTVASKMSVVIPISFSMMIEPSDRLSLIKGSGIILALAGVLLTVLKPGEKKSGSKAVVIPLLLFLGMGMVDALVKYSQHRYVPDEMSALFTSVLFAVSFFTGVVLYLPVSKNLSDLKQFKVWLWGILLGIVNFGSIYFILRALNYRNALGDGTDSSIIFGINNIGIVSLSVFLGSILFREKLRLINWLGIAMSAIAFLLFMLS